MEHVLGQLEPTICTIGGVEFPMVFSMKAAAMMEEELDTPYPAIVQEMLGGDEGENAKAMPWARQAAVIACMMRAAGVQITAEELMGSVHMTEAQGLCNNALAEMVRKQPRAKPGAAAVKNG